VLADVVEDQGHHLVRRLAVEVAGRLIGEDDSRPVDQRSGDGDPLTLAAGMLREPLGPFLLLVGLAKTTRYVVLATAFLAATATKVAVYVLLRFYFSVFGGAEVFRQLPMQEVMLLLALAGMFVASSIAIFQTDLKRLFAYSSVGQIGYIILGLSFNSTTGLTATIVHLFNHGVTKGAVFMLLGGVALRLGGTSLARIQGLGRIMPLTSAGIVLCGLSLIGVPGTAGFVSKWYLLLAALQRGQWWLVFLIVLSSLLAVAYVWRFVEAAYLREPRKDTAAVGEAPWSMLAPSALLVVAVVYFGLDTQFTVGSAAAAAAQLLGGGP